MKNPPNPEHQRLLLLRAVRHAHISSSELWLHYFAIGGDAGEYEVEAYLHGSFTLPPLQRDLLAHAANELIDDRPPPPRAPYSTDENPAETFGRKDQQDGAGSTDGAHTESSGDRSAGAGGDRGGGIDVSGAPGQRGGSFAGRRGDSQDDDTGWASEEGNRSDGNDPP